MYLRTPPHKSLLDRRTHVTVEAYDRHGQILGGKRRRHHVVVPKSFATIWKRIGAAMAGPPNVKCGGTKVVGSK